MIKRLIVSLLTGAILAAAAGGLQAASYKPRVLSMRGADIMAFDAVALDNPHYLMNALALGASPDARDNDGITLLMAAAWRGHPRSVSVLLAAGADIDATDSGGFTALMWAASNGWVEVTDLLLAEGASVDIVNGRGLTALMHAAWNGHARTVARLLAAGADTTVRDARGRSALDLARESKSSDVVQMLTVSLSQGD